MFGNGAREKPTDLFFYKCYTLLKASNKTFQPFLIKWPFPRSFSGGEATIKKQLSDNNAEA